VLQHGSLGLNAARRTFSAASADAWAVIA